MIISKTPFRISFGGGLSDLKEYYERDYGAVTSTVIDKYIYITVNKKFDEKIRVSYSKTEIVNHVNDIHHPLVREALKLMGIHKNIEITSIGNIPSGTGLGSSSAFTVGLLNALHAFKGEYVGAETLAKESCQIEIDILKGPIGKQDQYAVSYGGLNHIRFNSDETVFVDPIICKKMVKNQLDRNLLMFYIGGIRKASSILNDSKNNMDRHREHIDKLRDLSEEIAETLGKNDLSRFGELLHEGWIFKKKTGRVSNPEINKYYEKARNAGALGGKILGAGGSGFLLVYSEPQNQEKVRKAISPLKETVFHLEPRGSRIIYVEE